MTDTPNLGITRVEGNQSQKHVTVNEAMRRLDAFVQLVVVSRTLTAPPVSPAYGDTYIIAASPTGAWAGMAGYLAYFDDLAVDTWSFIQPNDGWTCTITAEAQGFFARVAGVWVVVSGGSSAYDFGLAFGGTPLTNEIMGRVTVPREVTVAANLTGSAGHVGANPTADFDIDMKSNGASVGTISFDTAGVAAFASAGGLEVVIPAGSIVTFVAQTTVDATISDITITILGDA